MGIDLVKRGRIKNSNKKNTRSTNLYVHLLIKLFRFMSRRTDSGTWAVILRRLVASRVNKPPVSLSKIIKHHSDKKQFDKDIAVIVATVTDDERILEIPKMNIAALKFTEAARARITKAGGVCMTLDELVKKCPTGKGMHLLRGSMDRETKKYFGKGAGTPGSHTKPRARGHNRKFEG